MMLLTGSRSRGVIACAALTLAVAFMLILASHASAAYTVPNFSLTAAPTQAAGHPKLTVSIDPDAAKADTTGGDDLKDITIDAPAGLQLNQAAATTKCTETTFTGGTCPAASQVGTATVKWRRSSISTVSLSGSVFVLTTPTTANTAVLGLVLKATGYKPQRVRAVVSNAIPVNAPTRVTVTGLPRYIENSIGLNLNATIDQISVVLNAKANAGQTGPYFTLNPSACTAAVTQATLTSWGGVVVPKTSSYTPTGCGTVLFQPTATVTPTVSNLNAPTGVNTSFTVPSGALTTQQSAVKTITIATPNGVLLSQPNLSAMVPCPEANLLADTCPLSAKIGATSFTFWGAAAAPGDVYLTASSAGGFDIGAVSRGANGVVAITRGTVREVDNNGDSVSDGLRLVLDGLPGATWSAASLNITSTLLRNSCPTGSTTTTIQGASAATVVRTGTWLLGICQPAPETTITNAPNGTTNSTTPLLTYTSSIAGSTFECQMDGSAFAACPSPYVGAPLTNTSHTFCVRAVSNGVTDQSPACRTFVVDTIPPTVTITSVGPTVSFVTEAGVTVTCKLNSDSAVNCTSPWSITIPDDASFTITICATDAAGNTGCATRVIDGVPPDTSITSGPSGYVAAASATFAFSATEPDVAFRCWLDSAAPAACASPVSLTGLTQGSHTFCVVATDAAGNVDATPACRTFTVDTVAPTVSIGGPPPSVAFAVNDASPILDVTCRINSGAATACSSPWTIAPPSGGYSLTICATDAAGNTGCGTLVVDPPPLTVTITTAPPNSTSSSSATFEFIASTSGATFECSFDGAAYSACTSPTLYSAYAMGSHTFCVRGRDSGGTLSASQCRTFTYELPPPPMQLIRIAPATSPSNSTSASFTVTNVPVGTTLMGSLDGGAASAFTVPKTFTGLADGAHIFSVYAIDVTGASSSAVSNTWVVDTVPPPAPTLTRVSPVTSPSSSLSAQFTFTDTESPVTFQASLDGGAYANATSPVSLTGLSSGVHTFSVRAMDAAGNISPSVSNSWSAGGPPPQPPLITGPSGYVASSSATITLTSSEPGLTFECQLDGNAWSACTSPISLSGLVQGNHTFCARARDAEGNLTGATCISWVVDTVAPPAPTLTRVSPTSSPTTSTSAQFAFTDSESPVTFQTSLDGNAFANATSPVNLTALANGTHTFAVRAVDLAGNRSASTSNTWEIQNGPIVPSITSGPGSTTATTSATFAFTGAPNGATYQCQLDGGAWTACVSPTSFAGLSGGTHTFCVRIVDGSGNISSSSCRTWTIDVTPPGPPTVTLVSPGASPTNQTTATISWFGAEPGGSFQRSIDGGSYGTSLSPLNLSNLANGCHTVSVRQVDLAGNIGSTSSVSWCVGGVPPLDAPTLTRTSPTSSPASQSTATFVVGNQPAGTTLLGSLDGAPFSAITSPINLTGLTDATHTFTVRLIDAAGTTSPDISNTWTVDTVAPAAPPVALTSPVASPTTQTSASIVIGMTESGVTLQGSLDGAPFATVASPVSLTGLSIGTHTYSARQVDPAGNSSSVSTIVWTIIAPTGDTVPPSISGLSSTLGAGGATVTYSASDDSGAAPTCTPASGTTFPFHSTATLIVEVSCLDGSGNMNWTSLNVSSNGPAAGLVTTLSGGPSGNTTNSAPTFSYTINRATSGTLPCSLGQTCAAVTVPLVEFNCTLDGSVVGCSAGSFTPPSLPLGVHTFCVASRGIYSGEASAPACRTFTVIDPGSTPPDVTVTSPPFYGGTGASPINVAYKVNGSTTIPAGTTCSVNSVPSTSPTTNAAVLELGSNAIPVTCANASGSDTEYVVMTRYSGFAVAITTPAPNSTTSSPSVNVTYNTRSYGASGTCKINGVASGSGSSNNVALPLGTSNIDLVCPWGNSVTKSSISVTRGSAPAVAITAPANDSSADTSTNVIYTVDGSASIPAGTTCRVNGVSSASTTTNTVALASGANLITVSCSNAYGFNTATVTVNNSVPNSTPSITSGPSGRVNTTSATFTFIGLDTGLTYQCQLDGGWTGCSSPVAYSGLSNGTHTFCVRSVDSLGNAGTAVCRTWTVDTIPPAAPTVTLVSPSTFPTNQTTATISFTGAEAGGTFQGSFDGSTFAAVTSPISLSGLATGCRTYSVRQVDDAGNIGSVGTVSWCIGGGDPPAPPNLVRVSPVTSPASQTTATFVVNGQPAGTTLQGALDGAPFSAAVSPIALSGLTNGTHTYSARLVDSLGNTSSTVTNTWVVDTIPPPAPAVSGPSSPSPQSTATITFSNTEAGVTCEGSLDGGAFAMVASPVTLTGLTDGNHTYAVRCRDAAGNVGSATTLAWMTSIESIPVSITSGPAGTVSSTSATFEFIAGITVGTTYECRLDGGSFASCASPTTYSDLPQGSHTFCVQAINGATTSAPACRTWTVDTVGPIVTITSPSGPTGAYPLVGNFTAVDVSGIGGTTCARDNGGAVACTAPYNLPATTSGVHTFTVCATDSASNTACATSSFDYESPMPTVTITSGPSGTVTSTSATFAFSSNLSPVTFSCNLDGSAYSTCTSPKAYSALTVGSHTFCVRATTTVGDVGPSACRTWTVATGNVVTITSGPAEGSVVTDPTATFYYAAAQQTYGTPCPIGQTCVQIVVDITPYYCSFDGSGYQFCGVTSPTSPRFTTPTLTPGSHTFCVRASGVAGIDPQTHNAIPNGVYGPSTCRSFTKIS